MNYPGLITPQPEMLEDQQHVGSKGAGWFLGFCLTLRKQDYLCQVLFIKANL